MTLHRVSWFPDTTEHSDNFEQDLIFVVFFASQFYLYFQFSSIGLEQSQDRFNGLVQDCNNSIANALELLRSCTKASILAPVRQH